jgi:uncharacterized protein (DUF1501 family)
MAALLPLYQSGHIAFVHGTGSPDESRSHFQAQDLMEGGFGADFTGWLGRHLMSLDNGNTSMLRAVAMGYLQPKSLITSADSGVISTVMNGIEAYDLADWGWGHEGAYKTLLNDLYAVDSSSLRDIGQQTLATIDILSNLMPPDLSTYPNDQYGFGRAMGNVATLIKEDLGAEVVTLNLGDWDTHEAQDTVIGDSNSHMSYLLSTLSNSLVAFYNDLGSATERVTVVVMSEFGRQLIANSSEGTDHGRGGFMMLLGDHVAGNRVFVNQGWQMLNDLAGQGEIDLNVLTDYRDVLGEVLRVRMNNPFVSQVFPNYTVSEHGLLIL